MILFLAAAHAQTAQQSQQPAPAASLSSQDVIGFLNQTIGWYQHLLSLDQQLAGQSGGVLFVDQNRQTANQVVRLSFDFAKAEALNLARQSETGDKQEGSSSNEPQGSRQSTLAQLADKADHQIQAIQVEIGTYQRELGTATGARRQKLESVLAETQSELELAQTRREVIQNMFEFVSGNGKNSTSDGLQAQIEELERTLPAAAKTTNPSAETSTSYVPSSAAAKAPPYGILALTTDLIAIRQKIYSLDEAIRLTDSLANSSTALRTPLAGNLRSMVQQGDALAKQADSSDVAGLQREKSEIDALTAQFKQNSDVLLPLSKQRVLLEVCKQNLASQRSDVQGEFSSEAKSLALRLIMLALAIAVIVGLSGLWRKAIYRYVPDARRRHQFLLIRRIVLWIAIVLIVAFAFATELGSLATFVGLLTAGIAVALQNVILSVAGYFFLIGRYGVRVGDRVQIGDVTGEVLDVSLVRLHLMELGRTESGAQPTGRVVVFSNSVVFSASGGFFKQIPGTSFVWRELTLTLAPESDYRSLEGRLLAAVNGVFSKYSDQMEEQHRQIGKTLGALSSATPLQPASRLHLTPGGLEIVIRYPVELENAAEIDDHVVRALLDTIEGEPRVKLVSSGTPTIQPVTGEQAAVASAE